MGRRASADIEAISLDWADRIVRHFRTNRNTPRSVDDLEDLLTNDADGSSVATVLVALRQGGITAQSHEMTGRSRKGNLAYEHQLTSRGLFLSEQQVDLRRVALRAAIEASTKGKSMKARDQEYQEAKQRCDDRTAAMVRDAVDRAIEQFILS